MFRNFLIVFLLFSSIIWAQLFQPKLILQQDSFDFGDIKQGEKVSHTFVLSNGGGDALIISDVRASCGCTAAAPEKKELAPGESTNLLVTFNSANRKGIQHKTVRIFSNDPENPEMMLSITGNVVTESQVSDRAPTIYFPETQHDFGKVNEGDKVDYTFSFANKGTSVLTIKDIKTSCGCTAALVSQDNINPGQEGTLKVELDTKNRSGKMSRTVTISSNDPKDPSKILTIYADVVKKGS
jgi:Protein of unknown function (DUF1573)